MVKSILAVATLGVVIHSMRVEGESGSRCIDGYRNWPVVVDSVFERLAIAYCDIVESRYFHWFLDRVVMAFAVHAKVVTIVLLGSDSACVLDVLVSSEVFATVTAVVSILPAAVDELLL